MLYILPLGKRYFAPNTILPPRNITSEHRFRHKEYTDGVGNTIKIGAHALKIILTSIKGVKLWLAKGVFYLQF